MGQNCLILLGKYSVPTYKKKYSLSISIMFVEKNFADIWYAYQHWTTFPIYIVDVYMLFGKRFPNGKSLAKSVQQKHVIVNIEINEKNFRNCDEKERKKILFAFINKFHEFSEKKKKFSLR